MTEQPRPSFDDLVYLLGQAAVELAFLRRRIAQLEAHQAAQTSPNGMPAHPQAEALQTG